MSERMPRIIVSIPRKMLERLRAVVAADGRSQGEIVRMVIDGFIVAREAQATILLGLKTSIQKKLQP